MYPDKVACPLRCSKYGHRCVLVSYRGGCSVGIFSRNFKYCFEENSSDMTRRADVTHFWLVVIDVVLHLTSTAEGSCTYSVFQAKEGQQVHYKGRYPGPASLSQCKEWCDTLPGTDGKPCVAFDRKGGYCFKYTTSQTLSNHAASNHYIRTCTPDACTMSTRTSGTAGTSSSVVAVPMSSTGDCSGVCKYLGDCEAVSYNNGVCSIFSAVTSTTQSDNVDYYKTTCRNGNRCCMETTTDKKATDAAVITLQQTVDSCEAACLNYDNCEAVHYKNNVCYFHLATATSSADVGSTFSTKSCTGDATDGTATIMQSCPATSGSYNCKRTGQDCANGGTCQDDGTCDCDSSFIGPDCRVAAAVTQNANPPCTSSDTCGPPNNGVCGKSSNNDVMCVCNAGWDAQSQTDPKCTSGRYKVVCSHDRMIININPYGTFTGQIYVWNKPDCTITDNYDTLSPSQTQFVGGKVREILHNDVTCGSVTPVSENGVTKYTRDVLVLYNQDYVSSLDEVLTVECTVDENNNVFSYGIDTNALDKSHLTNSKAANELQPVSIEVMVDGIPLTAGNSVNVGQTLSFTLSVGSGLSTLLLYGVRIDNAMDSDNQFLDLLENGCKSVTRGSDIWVSLPQDVDGPNKVKFEVKVFVFTKSSTLKVTFTTRVCASVSDALCTRIPCSGSQSSGRKKRLAGEIKNQTTILEKTFHVAYPSTSGERDTLTDKTSGKEVCETSDAMINRFVSFRRKRHTD
ncbi:EGF-like domain-containing protein 2 isoform X2 [Gigantopelta aegis]|uniref:EGF-like domain-containing protein 2 isoform X2 n=1 Tax=Gigantopelta aegis TaxID=1735272 RepID=UPI001B88B20D|nr:EGF-like domain-containing protein 2 isoform X2 [Gigantopelta aegis]